MRHFFPPYLPLVPPKFPHDPLELDGWRLGSEERRCPANCPCNQFPRFPTYGSLPVGLRVPDPDPPMSQTDRQTDRQTDGRTTCDLNTAFCTKVHRAIITYLITYLRYWVTYRYVSTYHYQLPRCTYGSHLAL